MRAVFVVVHCSSRKGAVAAEVVDIPLLVSGLTREKCSRLKKDQLFTLAEEEEAEMEEDMTRIAMASCLISVLGSEEMWTEQVKERKSDRKRKREGAYLERLARKVADMRHKPEQIF